MNLSIAQALRVDSSPCIAFIGAGGKTTALFQLARTLSKAEGQQPVIVTATSHLGAWQVQLADRHIMTSSPAPLEELEYGLRGIILVTGEMDGDRSSPIHDSLLNWLYEFCGYHSIPLLIEADGSRQKPLKAWAEHEPPIPSFVKQVVQVVGLSGLGKPLSDEFVHRPEIFSKISGLDAGAAITSKALTRALIDPKGGLKNIPAEAHRVVLLNQADTNDLRSTANRMVQPLLSVFDSVIISSLNKEKIHAIHEHVAGIILAAGESTRYGQIKQLLDWRGEPFVRAVARTALDAGLSPVVVVTGANAEKIESAVTGLNVGVARNADWKSGQGSSIRIGILAIQPPPPFGHLPPIQPQVTVAGKSNSMIRFAGSPSGMLREGLQTVGGAIFLLADQPQVTTSIIRALIEKHAEGLHSIIAPLVMDQRANPVLFDHSTFKDLLSIEGDMGGRAIFHKHRVEYLAWHDERLLLDVDTPEMYQRLISDESL
jgi:molybdenum cofactor cytidylyltransferase